MADHIAIGFDEYRQRLDRVQKLAKETINVVRRGYDVAEAQLARPDYASVDASLACANAGDVLAAARILCQEASDELAILLVPTVPTYRAELRVGFPVGITHFEVDNAGAGTTGQLVVHGRNDTPTSLCDELFEVGDDVNFLASTKLAASDLNVFKTIAAISGNTIRFTTAFGTAPTAGNDYALHMVLRTRHVA